VTWIPDRVPFAMPVHLTLCDVAGRLVRTIDLGQTTASGTGILVEYRDASGRELPSGTYFLQLTGGTTVATLRVVKMPR